MPPLLVLLLSLSSLISPSSAKSQYVEPLNMGMKVTIPWDIANIFNRFPIQGTLSAFLAMALGGILFFGVITAPFGYIFGIPSEKYLLGAHSSAFVDSTAESQSPLFVGMDRTGDQPRFMGQETWDYFVNDTFDPETSRSVKGLSEVVWRGLGGFYNAEFSPDFMESMFYLMPREGSVASQGCQLLTVCHAHATLKRLPITFLRVYKVFSGKMGSLPKMFKEAIIIGMEDEERCSQVYGNYCPDNPFTITLKSYLHLLPHVNTNVPKRKQDMYI